MTPGVPTNIMMKESTRQARARNLEILKYGRTILPSLKSAHRAQERSPDAVSDRVKEAEDPMLTALAQLAALRMNSKRAFIGLIDEKEMHVLAEATRTLTIFDCSRHDPDDELKFGAQSVALDSTIASLSVPAYLEDVDHYVDHDTRLLDASKMIVPNLKLDPITKLLPSVVDEPIAQFYAEVPLRNPAGLLIGILAVFDDTPRSLPASINVQPMFCVAQLIVNHLELVSLKDVTVRAERLVQGLSHFNTGHSSISNWAMAHPKQALHSDAANHATQEHVDTFLPLSVSKLSMKAADTPSQLHNSATEPTERTKSCQSDDQKASTLPTTIMPSEGISPPPEDTAAEASTDVSAIERPLAPHPDDTGASISQSGTSGAKSSIAYTFARASNLIRESMDLDGVCFLEISSAGRFDIDNQTRSRFSAHSSNISTKSSTDTRCGSTQDFAADAASKSPNIDTIIDPRRESDIETQSATGPSWRTSYCRQFAFSRRDTSSLTGVASSKSAMTLTEGCLKELIRVYPSGRIYNFDACGAFSSEDESALGGSQARRSLKRKLADAISKGFLYARSLIFIPLYDNDRRHPYAAFFGWTQDPFRILVESESIYVSGFTNSLMCEVMRLETLATDQAKSDFVSSISHELRSPLHGILAATQLLQGSGLSLEQTELAIMVDSCGKTLLDILDHVLEHARINNVIKLKEKSRSARRLRRVSRHVDPESGEEPSENLVEFIDLVAVVEETVSSVAAGHFVSSHRREQSSARRSTETSDVLTEWTEKTELPLVIIMDVDFSDHWFCQADAGSWRRIVMNLLGNALKYTVQGHVTVSLRLETPRKSRRGSPRQDVVLTIQDTGKGISDSYLKHRLYTPFAQENNLSVGVGLGLSIVDRLVASMGGNIGVQSEVDVGTKIVVRVPIDTKPAIEDSPDIQLLDFVRGALRKDDTVCLVGFDVYPDINKEPTGIMTAHARALLEMKTSLIELVSKWLGLQITREANKATILMVERSCDMSLVTEILRDNPKEVITIAAYGPTEAMNRQHKMQSEYLMAPIGPLKIARAFKKVVEQRLAFPDAQLNSPAWMTEGERSTRMKGSTSTTETTISSIITSSGRAEPSPQTALPRLLLVDDNDINLRLLVTFVRKLRLPYLTATNGQIALDQYKSALAEGAPISYIFMDLSMPVMDGLTSTRLIRAHEKEQGVTKPAVIIAMTGLGHLDTQREAEQSGFDQYHCKPVKLGLVKEIMDRWTG